MKNQYTIPGQNIETSRLFAAVRIILFSLLAVFTAVYYTNQIAELPIPAALQSLVLVLIGWICTASLITAVLFIRQSRQVTALEEIINTVSSLSSEMILITDSQGRITFMNDAAIEGFRIKNPDEELFAENLGQLTSDSTDMLEEGVRKTAVMKTVDGRTLDLQISCRRLKLQPRIEHCLLIISDQTRLIGLQNQLHQFQKIDSVGQLACGMAHDINNSLTGIMGASELLNDLDDDIISNCVEIIRTAASQAGLLTKRFLSFSRRSTIRSSAVDMASVTKNVIMMLRHTVDRRIAVVLKNSAKCTAVLGSESQLLNALLNLGINASHAMPKGGKLTFQLKNITLCETITQIQSFSISPGSYLQISVTDSGTGISPSTMSKIFDPFFTTKNSEQGTGLGLSAVRSAVEEHRGAVSVYSELGVGTVFHLYLPLAQSESVPQVEKINYHHAGGTVLVVDDEELIRETSSALLMKLGYDVLTASDGIEAEAAVRDHPGKIDLILLDIVMPGRSGFETLEYIRATDPTISIVLTSGFSEEMHRHEYLPGQTIGFLEKPFTLRELSRTVSASIIRTDQDGESEKTQTWDEQRFTMDRPRK